MKSAYLNFLMGIAVLGGLFSACSDDDTSQPQPTPAPAATITFTSPTAGQSVARTDTAYIRGTITTRDEMHGYSITIRKKPENIVVFYHNAHEHGTTATFDKFWVNSLSGTSEMEVEVTTVLDHDGNTAGKVTTFQAVP